MIKCNYIVIDLPSFRVCLPKYKREVADIIGCHVNSVKEGLFKHYIVKEASNGWEDLIVVQNEPKTK